MTDLPGLNVLVTGATGYIGSHLCRALVERGCRVFALSRSSNVINIKQLLPKEYFHLLQGNILDITEMNKLVRENEIEAIFHLAARLPEDEDLNCPLPSLDINGRGTLNLLYTARENKVARFIYSSSIDVYSEPPDYLPVDEKHPTCPHTPYGTGKLMGELYAGLFSAQLHITTLRYSIVYGRGGKTLSAISRFTKQAFDNEPLTVYGDGKQSNDFVYIDDIVQANLLALERDKPGIYNIGSGQETSISNLAETIIGLNRPGSGLIFTGAQSNRPFRFALDISQARKALGYQPHSLSEGLSEFIEDLRLGE